MFIEPIVKIYSHSCQIVGLLDADPLRFEIARKKYEALGDVPTFSPNEFDNMIAETSPDIVIVAGPDHTHAAYIVKALENDLDVITEKPMVTTSEDCRRVLQAQEASKGTVRVSLNYRYAPIHTRIKELILEGKIGRITSVDLNWYIDTYHGASYFQRWNRKRANSGGLSIHKSTHHFDLIQWWIDQTPVEAFAYGALHYYGPEGELNPKREDGRYCGSCEMKCDYITRWSSRARDVVVKDDHIEQTATSRIAKNYSTYRPDGCIFDSEIDIEDTYTAVVKYDRGALLSYSVNFSLPYEGYRLAINGTKGRIETKEYGHSRTSFPVPVQTIDYFPIFGSKETIHVVQSGGAHGGADPIMQEDLFLGPDPKRTYEIVSGAKAGAYSVAVGEAVWRSVKENRPITMDELLSIHKL